MHLMEIEEQYIKPMPTEEKKQLIRDVQRMIAEETGADLFAGTKDEAGWNFAEAAETAKNLHAYLANRPGPDTLDEANLVYVEGCGV